MPTQVTPDWNASLRDKTAIVGIGWTEYSKNSGRSVLSLAVEACKKAVTDSGLAVKDVDGIITFAMGDSIPPQQVAACLGLPRLRYHGDFFGGGPMSQQVVMTAAMAVATGAANYVLVYRALNGRSGRRLGGTGEKPSTAGEAQFFIPFGWTSFAHSIAVWQTRHMALYGTTERQFGMVAVTAREYAVMNDRAMMRAPMTIDDYLKSKWICRPMRLLDICPETDGACSVLVTSAERARDLRQIPAHIMAAVHGGGPNPSAYTMNIAPHIRWVEHTALHGKYNAPELFGKAGITAKDIDVAEIYDDMTISTIMQLEDFGFCDKGEGGPFVEEGNVALNGKLPTNTHGGLLSEGYLHGLNHVVEAVSQLRGQAGKRQVRDAQIALTTGGAGTTGSALVLRR